MRVITYGTFDLFHYGHYNLLKRAKLLNNDDNFLIVGVSSDDFAEKKGKVTILSQSKRMQIIYDLKFVDKVILEKSMEQKVRDVEKYKIDVLVLGDDYKTLFPKMIEYRSIINLGCKVIFLKRTKGVSSTNLKQKLQNQMKLDKDEMSIHKQTINDVE